jgi:hypothetical protein
VVTHLKTINYTHTNLEYLLNLEQRPSSTSGKHSGGLEENQLGVRVITAVLLVLDKFSWTKYTSLCDYSCDQACWSHIKCRIPTVDTYEHTHSKPCRVRITVHLDKHTWERCILNTNQKTRTKESISKT